MLLDSDLERLVLSGRRRMVLQVLFKRGSERKLLVADITSKRFHLSVKVVHRLHVLLEFAGKRKHLQAHLARKLDALLLRQLFDN